MEVITGRWMEINRGKLPIHVAAVGISEHYFGAGVVRKVILNKRSYKKWRAQRVTRRGRLIICPEICLS